MRFSLAILLAAALVAITLSAPTSLVKRSLLTEIDGIVSSIEDGAGVTAIEDELDKASGGAISKLEAKLGITFAEKLLNLSKEGASPGDLQAIGKGIYYLEVGTGIEAIDTFIDQETGGAYTSLEKALGITDLESALGIGP